jgi:glucose/arabinose dehydrogenase
VPSVDARGQGGLLDVALHPDFATNRLINPRIVPEVNRSRNRSHTV